MLTILPNYLISTLFRFAPTEPYSLIPTRAQAQQGKIELGGFEAMKTLMRRITQANPPYAALKNQANVNNEEKVEREKVKNSVGIHKLMESDPIDSDDWRLVA